VFLPKILRMFEERGIGIDLSRTSGSGDATRIAREAKDSGTYDLVIAAGGDGTMNEVLNGLMPDPPKMAILPLGTSNVLARALRIPLHPLKAAEAILSGSSRKIDVGVANGRYFAIMLSCGYDAYAIEKTNLKVKRFTRKYAYIWAGVKSTVRFHAPRVRIVADGRRMENDTLIVVISNAHLYGGDYQLTPNAKIDDGLFDVFVYKGSSVVRLLYYGLRIMAHLPVNFPDTVRFRARELELSADRRVLYQGDGDLFGELPVRISILPRSLEVAGASDPVQG